MRLVVMDFGVRMVLVALLAGFLSIAISTIYEDKFDNLTGAVTLQNACNDHIDNDGDGYCDYSYSRARCDDGSIVGDSDCTSISGGVEGCSSERCNGIDDDCDGIIDEDVCEYDYFCDSDGDGAIGMNVDGSCEGFRCVPAHCNIISGRDCNDISADISPFVVEECDFDGIDNDCDGQVDECSIGCNNLVKDDDESDVDCGGVCGACNHGLSCERNDDCLGSCTNGKCEASINSPVLCNQISSQPMMRSITVVPSGFDGNLQLFESEVTRLAPQWGAASVNAFMREADLGCYIGCDGSNSLCCDTKEAVDLAARCGSEHIIVLHNTFDSASKEYEDVFILTRLYNEQLPVCVLGEC